MNPSDAEKELIKKLFKETIGKIDIDVVKKVAAEISTALQKDLRELEDRYFERLMVTNDKFIPPVEDEKIKDQVVLLARITICNIMEAMSRDRVRGLTVIIAKEQLQRMIDDPFGENHDKDRE